VTDDFLRFSLLDRIIDTAAEADLNREASEILSFADGILRRNSGREWFEEYSIVSAKRRLVLGKPAEAERLLSESLERIQALADNRRKRFLLEEMIGTCLLGGELFQPLLRRTIDAVLVLDDPLVKTELLAESAKRLFGRGLVKDTQDLLQLTLSQVGSLGSPWDKAVIFSRIALVYRSLKTETRVREYAARAVREIESVQVIIRTEQEAAQVGTVAENLARLSLAGDAFRVAETIEYPWIFAETLCRMGIIAGDNFIDRAYEAAAAIADDARRLSTLFQLDLLLVEAGRAGDVEGSLVLREAELSSVRSLSAAESYVSRLARLYAAAGDTDSALAQARTLRDGYNRAAALIGISRTLLEKRKIPEAYAILDESYSLAETASRSRDRLFQDISGFYLAAGDHPRAAAAAMRITEPYPFAAAVADISRYLLRSGERLDAESRRLFGNFFAGG
jgi:tetratricopeptide (TPR) repeat protein